MTFGIQVFGVMKFGNSYVWSDDIRHSNVWSDDIRNSNVSSDECLERRHSEFKC